MVGWDNRTDFPPIFMTLIPGFTITELRVVSMEHLQRVWLASRERLPFRTPGSVPLLGTCLCSNWWSKIEKVPRGIRGEKSSKDMASSRNLVSTIGALASPKIGTEPGVRKGKRSLLASHTRCKCSMETTRNSVMVKPGIKVNKFYRTCYIFFSTFHLEYPSALSQFS